MLGYFHHNLFQKRNKTIIFFYFSLNFLTRSSENQNIILKKHHDEELTNNFQIDEPFLIVLNTKIVVVDFML